MNASTDFDRLLATWLESAGPADIRADVTDQALAAARLVGQRRGPWTRFAGTHAWPAPRGRSPWMAAPRLVFVALLLMALALGALAVAGQFRTEPAPIAPPPAGVFGPAGDMSAARVDAAAATLVDGRVLVVGGWNVRRTGLVDGEVANDAMASASVEIFDPTTGRFSEVGSMATPRRHATATLLPDGRVLVAGGFPTADTGTGSLFRVDEALASAEVFDPDTERFTPVGSMVDSRGTHTATLLGDGTVLLVGGLGLVDQRPLQAPGVSPLRTAEVFDPTTDTFRRVGDMPHGTQGADATRLVDGSVMIAGVAMYDPATGTFRDIDGAGGRSTTALATLDDGRVLMIGFEQRATGDDVVPVWEVYDPGTGRRAPIRGGRFGDDAVSLPDGRVLVLGSPPSGVGMPVLPTADIFDPTTDLVQDAGPMVVPRERGQILALDGEGRVLIAGGLLGNVQDSGSVENPPFGYVAYESSERYSP